MAFLLPFLGQVAAVKTALDVVAPNLFAGPAPLEVSPATRRFIAPASQYSPGFTGTYASYVSPAAGGFNPATLAVASDIPRTLLDWLKKYAIIYGPAVADAVWQELQRRRRSGQSTTLAKAAIDQAYPEIHARLIKGGRRRMNPTNVRALRRALRRVRSFKRVTRKVKGLGLFGRGRVASHGHRVYSRPRRRGDLWDVEDQADLIDEAEDLGYTADFFDVDGDE